MKTLTTIYALSALFGSIAIAVPVNKRDVVWVTEWEIDTVVVPITETVWVDASSVTQEANYHHSYSSVAAPTTTVTTDSTSSAYAAPASTSSSAVYVAPTTSTSAFVAPSTISTSEFVAPTTSSTSEYVAPTTPSTSEYVAPTTTSTSESVAPTTTASEAGASGFVAASSFLPGWTDDSITGEASAGTSSSGDITYYDPSAGYGACGWQNSSTGNTVAISHLVFNLYNPPASSTLGGSNGNPLCGMAIEITSTDGATTYQAEITDMCPDCDAESLDLTENLWNLVDPSQVADVTGRASNIKWQFTSTRLQNPLN